MPRIPDSFFQQLLAQTDIESVVSPYVRLKRTGQSLVGLCPFHSEKTASFTVDTQKGLFYCFGCGVGGSAVTFLQKIESLDFMEAVRELAEKSGLKIPEMDAAEERMEKLRKQILEANRAAAKYYHTQLMSNAGRPALEYLLKRGITKNIIRQFGLGFAPNDSYAFIDHMKSLGFGENLLTIANLVRKKALNVYSDQLPQEQSTQKVKYFSAFWSRIMFPIIDVRGRVIAFGGRVMDESQPKYVNTSDTPVYKKSAGVYALNFAKNAGRERLILAEGYMDVIALHQAGFTQAVACLGTATTKEQALLLRRYSEEIVLSYDADDAGQRAAARAINIFDTAGLKVRVLRWDKERDGKDPDEIIRRHGSERFQRLLDGAANDVEFRLFSERASFDLKTDDGKRGYLTNVCQILAEMHLSETTTEIYAGRLSQELEVDKRAIIREIERRQLILKRQKNKKLRNYLPTNLAPIYSKEGTVPIKQQRAEETLLSSLLCSPVLYRSLNTELSPELFSSEQNRRVAELLFARLDEGLDTDPTYFGQDATPEELATITRLHLQGKDVAANIRECRDCINVLQAARSSPPDDIGSLPDEEWLKLFSG